MPVATLCPCTDWIGGVGGPWTLEGVDLGGDLVGGFGIGDTDVTIWGGLYGVGPSGPPLVPGVPQGPFPVYQCPLVVSSSVHLAIQHPLGLLFWALGLSLCIALFQCHNCLKGDIVEALQFLKCLIRCDLIFRADPSAYLDDDEDEDEDILTQGGSQFVSDVEKGPSWDDLWLEDDDDAGTKG